MVKLTQPQIDEKKTFLKNYINASNAANGSKLDANANVSQKNIATLSAELHKDFTIQINRSLIKDIITRMHGKECAEGFIEKINNHVIYIHDETHSAPYCASISLFPYVLNGLSCFGGETKKPKHLSSFNGGFINLVFAVSSQFAGAVATVEWLMYFDYFARKEYGDNYLETHKQEITQEIQSVVYALNQPAAARGFQSVFWNISIYDKPYFDAMFNNFRFPVEPDSEEGSLEYDQEYSRLEELSKPNYNSLNKLQKYFMKWFNAERTKALLTFPVVTAACLHDKTTLIDTDFKKFIANEYAEGNGFFTFTSNNAYALSSCCRLKNDISDVKDDFSFSLGAGGVATGSMNVISINFNRLIQDGRDLATEVKEIQKYQLAFKELFELFQKNKMLPTYDGGFISLKKQYLTIGINGMVEAAEYLGYDISNNKEYKKWVSGNLKIISDLNKEYGKLYNCKFNTEFVPAENLGVKFAKWDREDGYFVPRDCYNSYLYKVEDESVSILDKFAIHGSDTSRFLDGGSAYHCNLETTPSKEVFEKLLDVAVKEGCEYFCFNVVVTGCDDCGYIDKRTLNKCSKCGSTNIWHGTRVIGYLKKIDDFSADRVREAKSRVYHAV